MDIYTNIYNAFSYKITPHSINFFQQTQLFVSHHYDRCVIYLTYNTFTITHSSLFFYYCLLLLHNSVLLSSHVFTSGLLFVVMLL